MVYFVCRSQYEAPLGHRIVQFEDANVLSWFQNHWIGKDDTWLSDPALQEHLPDDLPRSDWADADYQELYFQRTRTLFEGAVLGFNVIWDAMRRWGTPPVCDEYLETFLSTFQYPEGEMTFQPHAVQAITDDDQIDIAWYLFDDEFAQSHPERVAYLLHETWDLPTSLSHATQSAPPVTSTLRQLDIKAGPNEGTSYCVFLSATDGETLNDITGTYRFDGVRLPDFAQHLYTQSITLKTTKWDWLAPTWPEELVQLRAFLLTQPDKSLPELIGESDCETLHRYLSFPRGLLDFRYEEKNPSVFTGDQLACEEDWKRLCDFLKTRTEDLHSSWIRTEHPPLVQATPHFSQIRFRNHYTTKKELSWSQEWDQTWAYLFFDDLWAATHPELAESLLHYGGSWRTLY